MVKGGIYAGSHLAPEAEAASTPAMYHVAVKMGQYAMYLASSPWSTFSIRSYRPPHKWSDHPHDMSR